MTADFQNGLRLSPQGVLLETPWSAPASATVSVNGICDPQGWEMPSENSLSQHNGAWLCEVESMPSGAIRVQVTNTSTQAVRLAHISLRWPPEAFSRQWPTGEFREYVHGGSFQGLACGTKCVGRKQAPLDFVAPSSMVAAYQRDSGEGLLLGVLPPLGGAFSEFRAIHDQPHFEGVFGIEASFAFDCVVPPGVSTAASPLVAASGPPAIDLLDAYGKQWKTLNPRPIRPPMVGWNSWDYASGAVTRDFMDRNADAAERLFGDALRVLCIDEGWEAQWGTWEPNLKFPEGLRDYADAVRARGCIPGIWTAPLLVNTYNPLFYDHPDWFASRADGQLQTDSLAYGPMAYLDVTRPEVLDHVKSVFVRLREAGFEYFKVDFCHCILNAARFADATVPRADLVRRAFQVIREAIGDDAYLLGCGAPYESVVGLVNAVRSTGDIHIYWGHVLRNAASVAGRWWMHGNLWNCDPDFLVVRGPDTAREPFFKRRVISPAPPEGGWMNGREFNEQEARTYALLVHLSAGDVILGDNLELLTDTGIDMLRRVLEPRPAPAVPVDLFETEQDLPRIWISRGPEDTLVGVFNWSDKPAHLSFDPAAYGLAGTPDDFWTGRPVTHLPPRMDRRSALALRYTAAT